MKFYGDLNMYSYNAEVEVESVMKFHLPGISIMYQFLKEKLSAKCKK